MSAVDPIGTITDLVHAIELVIDQAAIDQVTQTLEQKASEVHHCKLADLSVPVSTFGGSATASELGLHHALAHEVMVETLQGVVADLEAYRTAIRRAETLIGQADESSAADLNRKQATAVLTELAGHDEAGRRNHAARNHYVDDRGGERA